MPALRKIAIAAATATLALTTAGAAGAASPRGGSGTVGDPWVPMRNAHVTCQTAGLYGNYSNGHHSNKIKDLPAGTWLGVRYRTSDGNSADVLWHDGDKWGFMLTSCFAFG
jgi:hypothetical protein